MKKEKSTKEKKMMKKEEKLNPQDLLEDVSNMINCFEIWEQSLKNDFTKLNWYVHAEKPFTFFICDVLNLEDVSNYDFENQKPKVIDEITFIEEYKIVNRIFINCRISPSMKRVFNKEEILHKIMQ
jgi:hypothetical protein